MDEGEGNKTLERWREAVDDRTQELGKLNDQRRNLDNRLHQQKRENEQMMTLQARMRDESLDPAFEALQKFVIDLVALHDGQDIICSDRVPNLPLLIEKFKELSTVCEKVVEEFGEEAVDTTQHVGESRQVHQDVISLQKRVKSDIEGIRNAVSTAESKKNVDHDEHMAARKHLDLANGSKNDFIYQLFGSSDTDSQIRICEQNEEKWHKVADASWEQWNQLKQLPCKLDNVDRSMSDILGDLDRITEEMRSVYAKLGEDRSIEEKCWIAVRTLQYHVSTNGEDTSRDDALRHVIKLTHTADKLIDDDSDVIRIKASIHQTIKDALGEEKAAALEREKVHLAEPEGVDY